MVSNCLKYMILCIFSLSFMVLLHLLETKEMLTKFAPVQHSRQNIVNVLVNESHYEKIDINLRKNEINIISGNHTSSQNTKIYVVTLQGVSGAHIANIHRLDEFVKDWNRTCGYIPTMHICRGQLDNRRGYGITKTLIACFDRAIEDSEMYPIFFEDDARLVNINLCTQPDWNDLPQDTFLALFGGHRWWYGNIIYKNFIHILKSFGTYGFMVPRHNLKKLMIGFKRDLQSGHDTLSPDVMLYSHARKAKMRVYATRPLFVSHAAGYSNTWRKHRSAIIGNDTHQVNYVSYVADLINDKFDNLFPTTAILDG